MQSMKQFDNFMKAFEKRRREANREKKARAKAQEKTLKRTEREIKRMNKKIVEMEKRIKAVGLWDAKLDEQENKINKKIDFMNNENKEIKALKKAIKVLTPKMLEINVEFYRQGKKINIYHPPEYDLDGTMYVYLFDSIITPISDEALKKYEVNKFYCENDDTQQFLTDFFTLVGSINDDVANTLNHMQSSGVTGFKITYTAQIREAEPVNILNEQLMNDNNNKKINSKYTAYKLNLEASEFKDLLTLEHNDYLKANFRPYSCLLTAIINKFYNKFNVIKKDKSRERKELTYSYLCEILEIPDKPSHNSASINQVVEKFFKRFNFANLYVYSPYMQLLFKHQGTNIVQPTTLRIIVKGQHVYEINENVKQLEQMVNNEDDERSSLVVSDKYQVIEKDETKELIEVYCDDIEEIFNAIKQNTEQMKPVEIIAPIPADMKKTKKTEALKLIRIITPANMNEILMKIIESGYTPNVNFNTFLYKINIFVEKQLISIETCDNNPMYGQQVVFENIQEYKEYNTAYDMLYKSVIKKAYISDHHDSVLAFENQYSVRPLLGYFGDEHSTLVYEALDEVKAYTHGMQSIKAIPKFNYFDVYLPYDNHIIEDLTYYVVEVLEETRESILLFGNKISRTYGYVLKACDIKYKIHYFRRPLTVLPVDYKTPIDVLYANENVCTDMKKMIVNKITGMLELKKNKCHLSKVFDDYDEAHFYSVKYNGKILPIITYKEEQKQEFSDLDDDFITRYYSIPQTHFYLVNVHEEKQLVNGLSPIKDMIYLNQRLKMYNLYKRMTKLNFQVVGCKTDGFFYKGSSLIIKANFPLTKKIGDYRIEEGKYLPNKKLILEENELVKIEDYSKVNMKTFEDEKDTVAINKYIDSHKQLLIKGEFPGVGKSTLCKKYDDKSLFILPYNRLCQNLKTEGFDAITFSRAFGLFKDDIELKNMKHYDLSTYDTIVFDEALLYTPERLKRLDKLIRMFPNKTFLSTGDTDQRNPIGFDNEAYLAHCMNVIFRNQVVLKDIKRLVNVSDIQRWKDLKSDIFNSEMSIANICKKHKLNTVSSMSEVKTEKNICYFNFRCDNVNNYVHRTVLKQDKTFYEGLEIVCRKYEKFKGFTLHTNYVYRIKSIKASVTITDEIDNIDYIITKAMLSTHFKLPYAGTCDSYQGISLGADERVTVFDSNLPYTDRKYFWTAITRARKLDNVSIFIHSDAEVERFTCSKLKQYLTFKCENYKVQDTTAKRDLNLKEFITADWIAEEITKKGLICKGCNKGMEIYIDENSNVKSNLTVDRINSKLSHVKSNCQLMCHSCNSSKNNR